MAKLSAVLLSLLLTLSIAGDAAAASKKKKKPLSREDFTAEERAKITAWALKECRKKWPTTVYVQVNYKYRRYTCYL
jgi:hypothetical protein